jgi:hypothetical protein
VFEVAHACKNHANAMLIRRRNAVSKWQEGI